MSDITVINDSEQSSLVTNGLAKNGELYLKASGSTDAGAIVVYDSGSWRTFANEASSGFSNTYSVDFDGSNDHVITSASLIDYDDMANGYTFSGWVWREDVPSLPSNGGTTNWLGGAYASADTTAAFPYLKWYLTDEYWMGSTSHLIRWYHGSQTIDNSVTLLPKGTWSHLAVTWDGSSTVTTYLNGSQLGQRTNAGSLVSRSDKMLIGAGNWYHKGKVDEVAYWNQGLSSSNITAIYNSGVPDDLSSYSPVGWWRMGDNDGGTGTTITDQGSGGNDATLTNGPTFSTDVPT
tara:strand:+ start:823 stop:1698 length:876 start_codon:yes stop_codon:yes gene_type:complete